MGEVRDRTIHDKFMAMYAERVQEKLNDDDLSNEFDPELGTVYKCQEKRCEHLPSHGHRRRPYVIWDRT